MAAGLPFGMKLPDGVQYQPLFAKQVFYNSNKCLTSIIPYLGLGAISHVGMELNCMVWADALLQITYDYMDAFDDHHGPPPSYFINRPEFHYIKSCMAIEQGKPNQDAWAFLLEEAIQEENKGPFRKYFNNTSPIPCHFANNDTENKQWVEFLIFTQHLQYWKTGKLVFVADYQGMRNVFY